ncbi:PREDICTED: NACHT, LRR and PYD domains-containing protein 3-like [Nanorana parkeri]|uniref:NACHT, LRR and PYD domains-containing protein 3-like n=1 Tax=Nanorana parkeri TaxID=125878 RepID=UPI0008540EF1|nr:PREDICTED: NACHT, LRR and PYD domains-containing protein 3-like [Nanorana parkeri]
MGLVEPFHSSYISEDFKKFHRQLSTCDDVTLRMTYDYFKDSLAYFLETVDTLDLLSELESQGVLNTEIHLSVRRECGAASFSSRLLQDISDLGRNAVVGFWECLYVLKNDYPHPNLLSILSEISQRGERLVEQILLDEHGHSLNPELKDMQMKHKQHLLEKTQTLVELKPPGSTLESESFYLSERYVNLIVVSTDHFRPRSQNELIQTGIKHEECFKETQNGLEHISPNWLFRWTHQSQCVPHAVMVSGVPGIGKTTLMQKFVYDWVKGEHYQRFTFVFFFKFRELNKLGEVSLEEMILQQYPHLEGQIGNILQHPERLLFIFDGLDESVHQMNFKTSKVCNDPKHMDTFGVIVESLVRQRLLKGCSVLMTSRPTRMASINIRVFQRMTEIMGFLHRDRLIYFEHFFGNKELSEKAFHYVQENDTLYTFCYIPSYCWIICTVLSMCFRAHPTITDQLMTSLPKTMTQLFVIFVSNILVNHNHKKDDCYTAHDLLSSIGWMAEHGVMNHIVVFDERHLDSFGVRNDKYIFSCFMMESGRPPNVDYTFLHLTLQEFFAASIHFIDYDPDKLQGTLDKTKGYKDGRAEIFLRFLCGLSDSTTRSMLKSHVEELSTEASRHVISWLQEKIAKEQKPERSIRDKKELLNVFYYLHESRNKELVLQSTGSNKVIDFSGVHLTPLDCSVLSFILDSCREAEELHLNSCNMHSEGLRKLVPALRTIKCLSLSKNDLRDTSCPQLGSLISNSQSLGKLDLSYNNLEDSSCVHLAAGVRNNQKLKRLDLSHNKLEGPHFCELMEAISRPTCGIEELFLTYAKLTDMSSTHLALAIRNSQTLRKLHLSNNNLEGPHFSDLMTALSSPTCQIEELVLQEGGLTDQYAPSLVSLSTNRNLKVLDLRSNRISDAAFCHIRDLIARSPSLKEICIAYRFMSEEVRRELKMLEDLRPGLKVHIY